MDKCWFVLRYQHYTAPKYESEHMAYGKAEGPLRLGHLIPSPKAVDNIINTGNDVLPFPKDMSITKSRTKNFSYAKTVERTAEGGTSVEVPIAAVAGLNIILDSGALFQTIMGSTWNIEHLETQIMQPTADYVRQCREARTVTSWIEEHKKLGAWKMYMVTGLMIARGARHDVVDSKKKGGDVGAGV